MAMQCAAHRNDGTRCNGRALPGSTYCFAHDPSLQAKRQAGSVKGGKGKSSKARARRQLIGAVLSFDDVDGLICNAMRQTAAGEMEASTASALASLSRALVTIRQANGLVERVENLERIIDARDGRSA